MPTASRKRRSRKPQPKGRPRSSDAHLERCRRNTEQLRRWANDFGKGARTYLARRSGLTFAAVARIVDGIAQPNPESARMLEIATDGNVSAAGLLGIESHTVATHSTDASPARLCSDGAAR